MFIINSFGYLDGFYRLTARKGNSSIEYVIGRDGRIGYYPSIDGREPLRVGPLSPQAYFFDNVGSFTGDIAIALTFDKDDSSYCHWAVLMGASETERTKLLQWVGDVNKIIAIFPAQPVSLLRKNGISAKVEKWPFHSLNV